MNLLLLTLINIIHLKFHLLVHIINLTIDIIYVLYQLYIIIFYYMSIFYLFKEIFGSIADDITELKN
jgi:hypothetical protein